MSAKKNNQAEKQGAKGTVDPLAVAFLTHQVRDLLRFHQSMGIETYPASEGLTNFLEKKFLPPTSRVRKKTATPVAATPQAAATPQPAASSFKAIKQGIIDCQACMLAEKRSGQVFGFGPKSPKLMVVGDWSLQKESFGEDIIFGPGEDVMLWRMMEAIGLSRTEVYVANIIKCCPATVIPEPVCAGHCFAHLSKEIAALKPGLIMAMGEMATAQLLGSSAPLVRLRGRFHPYRYPDSAPARVMPTFHPRFLLANPEMKKMVWQDLQMVQKRF